MLDIKPLSTIRQFDKGLSCLLWQEEPQLLTVGSYDNQLKCFNLAEGSCTAVLRPHSNWVTALALHTDSGYWASAGCQNEIRLWNGYEQTLEFRPQGLGVRSLSNAGQLLASGNFGQGIDLWSVPSADKVATLTGHSKSIDSLLWISERQWLISGSSDRTIKVWDLGTGSLLETMRGHHSIVSGITQLADKNLLVSCSSDESLLLWDRTSLRPVKRLLGHSKAVLAVTRVKDQVASAGFDHSVRLWDTRTMRQTLKLHEHRNRVTALAWVAEHEVLVSGSYDRTMCLWPTSLM
jgi:WD40 repeat protein